MTLSALGIQSTAGQLGVGDTTPIYLSARVGCGTNWSSVTAGKNNFATLALQQVGSLWTWGDNLGGQPGQNDTVQRHEPVQIVPVHPFFIFNSLNLNHYLLVSR